MTPRVVGIVLAGGASSRFGSDKLAAPLDGRPLLDHALLATTEVVEQLILVLAPEAPVPPLPESIAARISVARDLDRHQGPLAGLASGLSSDAASAADLALVVGGDMPSLAPAVLTLLVKRLAAEAALAAMTLDASPPSPMPLAIRIAPASAAATTLLAQGRRSLRSLLDAVSSSTVRSADWLPLDPDGRTLRDVDTPEDLDDN